MQCPKCHYEPTMDEIKSSHDRCPKCRAQYAKAKLDAVQGFADVALPTPINLADLPKVAIADVSMPFSSMVLLMIKLAFAAVPAAGILAAVIMIVANYLGSRPG